jgi:hypothetical protein
MRFEQCVERKNCQALKRQALRALDSLAGCTSALISTMLVFKTQLLAVLMLLDNGDFRHKIFIA